MLARENPFRTERMHSIEPIECGWTWDGLEAALLLHHRRGALVGPEGRGKSTLLRALESRWADEGWSTHWVQLSRESRNLPLDWTLDRMQMLGTRDALLIDGWEQLGGRRMRQVLRSTSSCGALVVTSHQETCLPTLARCETTPALLRTILSMLAPGAEYPHAERLLAKHAGNIREAIRALYDHAAGRGMIGL